MNVQKTKILFLCTGNSCRSQIAEGWARKLKSDFIEPYSAGIEAHGLNSNAVQVMAEAGVDISEQRSKRINDLWGIKFDCVVTLCSRAQEHCPVFPDTAKVVNVAFANPVRLATDVQTEEAQLALYRRLRNEIRLFVEGLPESL